MSASLASRIEAEIHQTLANVRSALDADYFDQVARACALLGDAFSTGGKVLILGNGGSAADAQHLAAELVGRYKVERPALAAIALTTDTSILTAWSNDYQFETVFSRQVEALARPGDVVWGISTSGNSLNVVRAFEAARRLDVSTIGLLGRDGGKLAPLSDCAITAPLAATEHIQTAHQMTYHAICAELDRVFDKPA